MLIRPALVDDIPRLMAIAAASPTSAHWTEQQFRTALTDLQPRRSILLLENGEKAIGFVAGVEIAGEWELENIVVDPAFQKSGVGARLLKAFLDVTRESGAGSVFLEVRVSNASARALYERYGFEISGMRRGYYHNPIEDAILYKKSWIEQLPKTVDRPPDGV